MAATASATTSSRSTPGRLGHEHEPVREHGSASAWTSSGSAWSRPLIERVRLGGAQQHQAGARRGAELHALVVARVAQQRDDVVAQRARRVHAAGGVLGRRAPRGGRRPARASSTRSPPSWPASMLGLGLRRRVAHRQPDHEAVHLRLGQRVGALVLDGVLRREDHERARELVRVHVDGDVALLHALEQAGLRLRRRAVDLVDEHDVGEDRARAGTRSAPRAGCRRWCRRCRPAAGRRCTARARTGSPSERESARASAVLPTPG